ALAGLGCQVDADAALAAVEAGEIGIPDLPRDVAAQWFDLDDLGTEIGQHHRGVWPGQNVTDLEDPDAGEWTRGRSCRRSGHRTTPGSNVRVQPSRISLLPRRPSKPARRGRGYPVACRSETPLPHRRPRPAARRRCARSGPRGRPTGSKAPQA